MSHKLEEFNRIYEIFKSMDLQAYDLNTITDAVNVVIATEPSVDFVAIQLIASSAPLVCIELQLMYLPDNITESLSLEFTEQ